MKTPVWIRIVGVQQDGDRQETIELSTRGTLSPTEAGYCLEYEETTLSGLEGTQTRMELSAGQVTLQRTGTQESYLMFQQGKRFVNRYKTPHGSLQMAVFPTEVTWHLNPEDGGEISLQYELEMEGMPLGANRLSVTISEPKYDQAP